MIIQGQEVPVDVQAELEQFEWKRATWTAEKLIACSPFREDRHPSFYCWLVETEKAPAGAWGDSGASGEYEKGGFISLLSFLRNESEEETIEYLISKYGIQNSDGKIILRKLNVSLGKKVRTPLPHHLLDGLQEHPYLSNRGISRGVQKAMKTGFDPKKNAIALPWFLPDGRLGAIKYRRVNNKRFFYAKGGFPIRELLYGIHILHEKDYLDTVVVTEAEIDAMSAMTVGFPAVAVGCSSFNEKHRNLLLQTNVRKVIIASDNDKAGRKLAKQIQDVLGMQFSLYQIDYPDGVKDLNDMDADTRRKVLNKARKVNGIKLI